jgi:hypothetical protein
VDTSAKVQAQIRQSRARDNCGRHFDPTWPDYGMRGWLATVERWANSQPMRRPPGWKAAVDDGFRALSHWSERRPLPSLPRVKGAKK